MPEPEVTGTNAIRARVWSRWKKVNLSITSRELQISLGDLEAFAKGEKASLSVEHMHKLCKEFYRDYGVTYERWLIVEASDNPSPDYFPTALPRASAPLVRRSARARMGGRPRLLEVNRDRGAGLLSAHWDRNGTVHTDHVDIV